MIGIGVHKRRFIGDGIFPNLYSMNFDGDAYLNIDAVQAALAATTKGVISGWVKPVDATPVANEDLIAFGDTDAVVDFRIDITTTGKLRVVVRNLAGVRWVLETDAAAFLDNIWSHFLLNMDAIEAGIYINSIKVPQTFTTSTDKTVYFSGMPSLDNGRIGCVNFNSAGNTNFFNGNMDEVSFWNDDFTLAEIQEIYNGGVPTNLLNHSKIANGVSWFRMGDAGIFS
jgi:hypothetical protein